MKKLGFVLFSMVAIALICSGSALAQNVGDNSVYFVAYYANNVSAAPDATVRVINDGSAGAFGGGDLYAGFYVFDDSEELITCCSCQVTPDGLLSESVKTVTKADRIAPPTRGVIKMISSTNGFFPQRQTAEPAPEVTAPGLRGWATHIQSAANKNPNGPAPYSQTETMVSHSNLATGEQSLLELLCWVDALLGGAACPCTPEDFDF